jgi:hypothetical protein
MASGTVKGLLDYTRGMGIMPKFMLSARIQRAAKSSERLMRSISTFCRHHTEKYLDSVWITRPINDKHSMLDTLVTRVIR